MADSVVLFGAGASYGSGAVHPCPPPLGKDLFDRLEERGGIVAGFSAELKALFRQEFETAMLTYFEQEQRNVTTFQRELAQYFAQFVPAGRNHYREIIGALQGHEVLFASLNYDLLFEWCAANAGFGTRYAASPYPNHLRLLKPHGSCNFWPNTDARIENVNIFDSRRADVESPVRPLLPKETKLRCVRERSLAPAIALYAPGKSVRICPAFVERQQHDWQLAVADARSIHIVGVRVYPTDSHIWEALAATASPIHYFGLPPDRDSFTQWATDTRNGKQSFFVESDFAHAVPHIQRIVETA